MQNNNTNKSNQDELFLKILESAKKEQKISTSYIQRKFGLSYPMAAAMIDKLESIGAIEKGQGKDSRYIVHISDEMINRIKEVDSLNILPIETKEQYRIIINKLIDNAIMFSSVFDPISKKINISFNGLNGSNKYEMNYLPNNNEWIIEFITNSISNMSVRDYNELKKELVNNNHVFDEITLNDNNTVSMIMHVLYNKDNFKSRFDEFISYYLNNKFEKLIEKYNKQIIQMLFEIKVLVCKSILFLFIIKTTISFKNVQGAVEYIEQKNMLYCDTKFA